MKASFREKWGLIKRMVGAGTLLFAVTSSANISYTLEGCRSTSIPDGYDLAANDYVCPDGAYTTGNLKGWAELDLVPHRVTIENKGSDPLKFLFTVGGDYLQTEGGDLRGWDYVSVLTLDQDLSNDICKNWAAQYQDQLVQQDLYVTPDNEGAGGVFTTIYRQISVAEGTTAGGEYAALGLPGGAVCVANYYQRLAVGSHLYPGSSLQSNLWNEDLDSGGIGEKRVQLPDVKAIEASKDMSARQDQSHGWSIAKSGPASVDFGDTCAPEALLSKGVDVNVTWTKLPSTPIGTVGIHTKIYVTNVASREIYANVSDMIYYSGGMTSVQPVACEPYLMAPNYSGVVCEHDIIVPAAESEGLYDIATIGFSDPFLPEVPIIVTLGATASASVQPGDILNATATVKDHEWIESDNGLMSFSSGDFTPAGIGAYDAPYVAGTPTFGDVNWTSFTVEESGSVIFHKTVSIGDAMITSGMLSDTATIVGDGGYTPDPASHEIALYADATVTLTINKSMPDVLDGDDSVDVVFTVSKEGMDDVNRTITFTAAGPLVQSATVSGLEPGTYAVTETAPTGFEPEGSSTQMVTITLPSCGESVTFNNQLAGQPAVKVVKVTKPAEIAGVPQKGDWNMTLYKEGAPGVWTVVTSLLTDPDSATNVLVPEGELEEGHYKVVETMKAGWYQSNSVGDCDFTVDYPEDLYRADYECTFENTKYGTVIINKLTVPAGMTDYFHFAQDINGSYDLNLTHLGTHTFMEVIPGTYAVTEDDYAPEYDLIGLECVETDGLENSATSLSQRKATIVVDPGETVACTYTNRKRGKIELIKYENGSTSYTMNWTFTLSGNGINLIDSPDANGLVDFNGVWLIPGAEYTVCETGIPAVWTNIWSVDGAGVSYYNPGTGEETNENHCFDFTVGANETIHFEVQNNYTPPGGDPRTIGYWKNWTTCDGHGNQEANAIAANTLAGETVVWLLDYAIDPAMNIFHAPVMIGTYVIETCEQGVAVLDKRDFDSGKKRAGDAAYGLAAQLLGAKLNYAAGATTCEAASDAIAAGDALLASIGSDGFDGTGGYLKGGKNAAAQKAEATSIAGTLDAYNNGELCP
ncbi:hypothetical protein WCX49_04190 [Sulfurimonas sp. HSL-1656]|uniref:hypothetical protein n=1 Tax=Thiomicrolovo subterrani TaxID=3131934 RepID=UPI0031F812FB